MSIHCSEWDWIFKGCVLFWYLPLWAIRNKQPEVVLMTEETWQRGSIKKQKNGRTSSARFHPGSRSDSQPQRSATIYVTGSFCILPNAPCISRHKSILWFCKSNCLNGLTRFSASLSKSEAIMHRNRQEHRRWVIKVKPKLPEIYFYDLWHL